MEGSEGIIADWEENDRINELNSADLEENDRINEINSADLEENDRINEANIADLEENDRINELNSADLEENDRINEANSADLEENDRINELNSADLGENDRINDLILCKLNSLKDTKKQVFVKLIHLLLKNTELTSVELSESLGLSETTILRYLRDLRSLGILSREGSRKSGSWRVVLK